MWTYDLARATLSRLTTDPAPDTRPLWTPDGQRIVFTSTRARYPELFWRPADGTGSDERLVARVKDLVDLRGTGWSADACRRGAVRDDGSRRASAGAVRARNAGASGGNRPFDIAPDGRFFIIRNGQADANGGATLNMILVENWFEELKRPVPN